MRPQIENFNVDVSVADDWLCHTRERKEASLKALIAQKRLKAFFEKYIRLV